MVWDLRFKIGLLAKSNQDGTFDVYVYALSSNCDEVQGNFVFSLIYVNNITVHTFAFSIL